MKRGVLLVLSAPSGAGKDTVCEALLKELPDLIYSVSATTRPKRHYEVEGESYFFMKRAEFEEKLAEGGFLEHADYLGHLYGTPRAFVEKQIEGGKSVILKIETKGAAKVMETVHDGVFIFLVPPTFDDLAKRLNHRASESIEEIQKRLQKAKDELATGQKYEYVVVNDTVAHAVEQIKAILLSEQLRWHNMCDLEIFSHANPIPQCND